VPRIQARRQRTAGQAVTRRHHPPTAGRASPGARVPARAIMARSRFDAALAYAAAGWPVLPVAGMTEGGCSCRRSCAHPGKHPLTRHGVHDATTDPVLIGDWWRRSAGANVGIATGAASGLVVVDVDLPRGGRESLRVLVEAGYDLPATLRSLTGGGGLHLFYAHPTGVGVANVVGGLPGVVEALPGIDLRGDGGYVVAPPSVHASGGRYRWDRRRVVALPAWMWPKRTERPPVVAAVASPTTGAAFCLGRLVGGGEVSEALVAESLLCAALAIGLGEPEAAATIRSGMGAGMAVPRRAPGPLGWQRLRKPERR